jgi:hypothetical protein
MHAGNHALALAYHGQELGIPVTVVMPRIAPITKVQNCKDLGATVLIHGAHIGEAREFAATMGERDSLTYINGYDHPHIIAGAGTLGMEIIEQVPDVEAVVIPVGGAGLIAGTALAIKALRPDVRIIGAEPLACPSLTAALEAGKPITVNARPTLADGLMVPRVGTNAFALCQKHVDKVRGGSLRLRRSSVRAGTWPRCRVEIAAWMVAWRARNFSGRSVALLTSATCRNHGIRGTQLTHAHIRMHARCRTRTTLLSFAGRDGAREVHRAGHAAAGGDGEGGGGGWRRNGAGRNDGGARIV